MKKWLTLLVLGTAVAAVAGLSSQEAPPPAEEPTEAEFEAHVDARLHEVMQDLLAGQRSEALPAAPGR
jgi:hypothetical protein